MNRQSFIIPLFLAQESRNLCVCELKGGSFFRDRCMNLGIIPGQNISLVRKYVKGPCIVKIRNSNIILGQSMARKILVTNNDI